MLHPVKLPQEPFVIRIKSLVKDKYQPACVQYVIHDRNVDKVTISALECFVKIPPPCLKLGVEFLDIFSLTSNRVARRCAYKFLKSACPVEGDNGVLICKFCRLAAIFGHFLYKTRARRLAVDETSLIVCGIGLKIHNIPCFQPLFILFIGINDHDIYIRVFYCISVGYGTANDNAEHIVLSPQLFSCSFNRIHMMTIHLLVLLKGLINIQVSCSQVEIPYKTNIAQFIKNAIKILCFFVFKEYQF